jgi:undecaprenyl-diphosphatase
MNSLSFDQVLFLYFNGNHSPVLDQVMALVSNAASWIPVYLICVIILLRLIKGMNPSNFIVNITLVLFSLLCIYWICFDVLPQVFQHVVNRLKPCYDNDISSFVHTVGDVCADKYGFFAPRACTVFALSTFLCISFHGTFKWAKLFLIAWALVVSYSRIYVGAHYPMNVVVSASAGILIGYLSFRFYFYIKDSLLVI